MEPSKVQEMTTGDLMKLIKGNYNCPKDNQDQIDCDLAERIWCLRIFHVRGFDKTQKTSTG